MTFLSDIHMGIKKLHDETDKKPFLIRYNGKGLILLDHYRHLTQLLPIYETLEKLIQSETFPFKPTSEFLQRSSKIKADLAFLKGYIPHQYREPVVLKSTLNYIEQLKQAAVDDEAVFSHFLLRILGDLFGGMHIKKYVTDLYIRNHIFSKAQGVYFYFEKGALGKFSKWLNEIEFKNTDSMIQTMNEGLIAHQKIFDELEESRMVPKMQSCHRFFTLKKAVGAISAIGAMVALCSLRQ